jgi:hypothetical protein
MKYWRSGYVYYKCLVIKSHSFSWVYYLSNVRARECSKVISPYFCVNKESKLSGFNFFSIPL